MNYYKQDWVFLQAIFYLIIYGFLVPVIQFHDVNSLMEKTIVSNTR